MPGENIETDLQDKQSWCAIGEGKENDFLDLVAPRYGFRLVNHPGKANDKYETDFQLENGSLDVDLKSISTPFFKAGVYGYDPNYTVTLNHKDYIRYMNKYPEWGDLDMAILLWIQIEEQENFGVDISGIDGVWSLRLSVLDSWIRSASLSCHSYLQRTGECGSNAKHSWLIDIRKCVKHEILK